MTERWMPADGYEGFYEVSDHGRLRRLDMVVVFAYKDGRTVRRPTKGGLLNPSLNRYGYPVVILCANGVRHTTVVHQLVAKAFVVRDRPNTVVCHKDGNPENNRADNLMWGTLSENQLHRRDHGTCSRGENSASAKLSDKSVMEIVFMRRNGVTRKNLAEKYGVCMSTIDQIMYGKIWNHVTKIRLAA